MIRKIISEHTSKKRFIKNRLKEFRSIWNSSDKKIFSELCFCICTPQSKAVSCDQAISRLSANGALFKGGLGEIRAGLKGVRFPNNKAKYIARARDLFTQNEVIKIKEKIRVSDIPGTRYWFARNVTGIGLKEASHFLRNIGFGKDLAVLDVHILRNMSACGLISSIPNSIPEKTYLLMEDKLRKFSKKINIPMDELDLLFWSHDTGEIFK
ncbi:MAG: N-glycosylase/DNA lyase [Candidatus Omnitrophica bacterium]|nr:N-glycosylase/DNA lyase [Candidatus Omnitrophota bacterium]MBU1656837.1 N-glycosylase/DNA lyase [Candidatus Omnitrophota bacterium]MBU1783897.1 N-glycosylase/DNA lyase [Candidatus Omnitrophota bacterium]MBU1851435.1 N-glycosylase/DNA lyase [Candidatus Omnitrophota bacterium]